MILSLRSNSLGQLGVVDQPPPQSSFTFSSPQSLYNRSFSYEEKIKYSPFVLLSDAHIPEAPVEYDRAGRSLGAPCLKKLPGVVLQEHFYCALHQMILENIKSETDWTVLETIFDNLAKLLKNKGLIMTVSERHTASTADTRYSEHSFPDSLIPILEKFASFCLVYYKLVLIGAFYRLTRSALALAKLTLVITSWLKLTYCHTFSCPFLSWSVIRFYLQIRYC